MDRGDSAWARKGCQSGYTAFYFRLPRLLQWLSLARGDGSYANEQTGQNSSWTIGGWARSTRRFLEILEERYASKLVMVTSQVPVEQWHDEIGDQTQANAILDRLVHGQYKLKRKGDSLRKRKTPLTHTAEKE